MGIFDFFSGDDARQAAQDQQNALRTAQAQGSQALTTGLDQATGSFTSGIAPFLTNLDVSQRGQNAYANALGVNGPQGNAAAVANFQGSPGYQYQLQQATDNYLRNAASTGMLGSGNTAAGVTQLAGNLANQNWQQYVQNLQPFLSGANTAAGGVQQGYGALGAAQLGTAGQQANMAYGTNVGIGNAQAQADMADYYASQNLMNFGLNAAKTLASFVNPAGGGGKGIG